MKLLERILVAADFSKSDKNVMENAIVLARTFHSTIVLIHILPDYIEDDKINAILKETAKKKLNVLREIIKSKGVEVPKPILEWGTCFDNVIQVSIKLNVNVIIIGAGEKPNKDTFQLGTTAEKIVRKSVKPVMVVKNNEPLSVKSILCPVDFSSESKRALKNAITMARRFNAELFILSICEGMYPDTTILNIDMDEYNEKMCAKHAEKFNSFLNQFNLSDLNWKKEIVGGDPAKEIQKMIENHVFNMLIMGTTGKTGLSRILMGSVTEKVIRTVPCTFITLKSDDIIELKLKNEIRDIESHYNTAMQLIADGFYDESINEFMICLNINDMHIPSLNGIAKVYEKMGNKECAERYKKMIKEVMTKIWNKKIETEIRKFYRF